MAALMREGFDHKLPRPGQAGAASLHFQPFAHIGGQARPLRAVTQKPPHSPGKVGGHGPARSAPIWNAGGFGRSAADEGRRVQPHYPQRKAGKEKTVARQKGGAAENRRSERKGRGGAEMDEK